MKRATLTIIPENLDLKTTNSSHSPLLNNIDNLNVIYDNDTTLTIEMASSTPPSLSPDVGAPNEVANQSTGCGKWRSQGSFVNFESGDDIQEVSDQFATCLLAGNKSAHIQQLLGRLNFWQPIKNRGLLHLIARIQYNTTAHERKRRESFQTIVEHRPHTNETTTTSSPTGGQLRHQIWLLDLGEEDCNSVDGSQLAGLNAINNLLGEMVSTTTRETHPNGGEHSKHLLTVDIDAELIVNRFNLTGAANPIVEKCLVLTGAGNEKQAGGEPTRHSIGSCRVTLSDRMPSVSELDHLPSVSVVQPIREDLLSSSSFVNTRSRLTTTTANNRSANERPQVSS